MKTRLIATLLLTMTALMAQEDHHKGVEQRGDQMMGFSHDKTTHHFRIYADGGAIEVTANDPNDTESRDKFACTYPISPACSRLVTSKRRCSSMTTSHRACLCFRH